MKIIIIGCGGRENILAHKLQNNNDIFCIGSWINPDIYSIAKQYRVINMNDKEILKCCLQIKPNFIVIGPESVLATNIVNMCTNPSFLSAQAG